MRSKRSNRRSRMRRLSLLALALASLGSCGLSQGQERATFPEVAAALERSDPAAALALLAPRVAAGDPAARAMKGLICVHLRVEACSPTETTQWLRPAAESGNADAQHGLALALLRHQPSEAGAALGWLEKAALADHPMALLELGRALAARRSGDDAARGAALVRRAAERGLAAAQFIMGGFCETGVGVERSLKEAIRWYVAAAEAGYAPAQVALGEIYEQGRGTPASAGRAERWYRASAQAGVREAQYRLGLMFMTGKIVEPRYFDGILWLQRAARAGHARAQDALGRAYVQGIGVRQSPEEAVSWFSRAAEQGLPVAQHNLAALHEQNFYVRDPREAAKWYTRAATAGYEPSMISLGDLYRRGEGVPMNLTLAQGWYARAAESEDVEIAARARQRMQSALTDSARTALAMFGMGDRFPTFDEVFFGILGAGIATSVLYPELNQQIDPDIRDAYDEVDRHQRESLQRLQEVSREGIMMKP